ncbi:hypothetical protein BDY19DRAFT_702552 [Irpex rosettiformis]|uniref:Uncharacterized protein n=1 Tax=Irpex rosettiformis TaxID=378272 RepID=A0ACB8TN00_9APHY|nr:hypothetical protein BDY19DRAFT_702552 [Irpex rosettiformis]
MAHNANDAPPDPTSSIVQLLQNLSLSPPSRDVFATQIISNYILYDLIFAGSSPGSILRVARTCHAAHLAMRDYFSRTFNINKHLSRFFDDPLAFRSLQARTSSLISGSSALQFLDRTEYADSDLDLYTASIHRQEIGRWLLAHGYRFTPNSVQDPDFEVASDEDHLLVFGDPDNNYRMKGITAVFTFHKPCPVRPGEERQVQVIVATRSPMEVVLRFHSTVVVNVISWDRAYSLYPRATFEHRKSVVLRRQNRQLMYSIIEKYGNRGFEFRYTIHDNDIVSDPAFTSAQRWIGDGHSWVLELSTEGITLPPPITELSKPLTRDPCFLTTWRTVRRNWKVRMDFQSTGRVDGFYYEYVFLEEDYQVFELFRRVYSMWMGDYALTENPDSFFAYYDQDLIEACEEELERGGAWQNWR